MVSLDGSHSFEREIVYHDPANSYVRLHVLRVDLDSQDFD